MNRNHTITTKRSARRVALWLSQPFRKYGLVFREERSLALAARIGAARVSKRSCHTSANFRNGVLSLALLAFAIQLIAHGGFDHVIGTVVKVENNVLTVKTATGNVDVRLNEKTEITRNDQQAGATDLKPGTRVVVDIPEGSKDKVAHSVKIGISKPAGTNAHSPQK